MRSISQTSSIARLSEVFIQAGTLKGQPRGQEMQHGASLIARSLPFPTCPSLNHGGYDKCDLRTNIVRELSPMEIRSHVVLEGQGEHGFVSIT